ncbi:hypothetical protein MHH70_12365 [Metasolibacillus sp. FSL H7-0170]|uniref:hypothetical protein n=1 Tax=Metasolibacillus sp. FSL H7-0170 TaxID=2921431 RepID=UPI0031588FDE
MNLLDILKSLTPKPVADYEHGSHILYSDIIQTCRMLGEDNHHRIDILLKQLADNDLITIVYLKASGFEDMIAGVILK